MSIIQITGDDGAEYIVNANHVSMFRLGALNQNKKRRIQLNLPDNRTISCDVEFTNAMAIVDLLTKAWSK